MPMEFSDDRSAAHQGNLPYATLTEIMKNSIYNVALPFGGYNRDNARISVTKGAHEGAFYPGFGNYYFDIKVNGGAEVHCLINNPSTANSSVLAVR